MLCNVYLHRLDRVWHVLEHGVLVRFADDVLVMCKSREQAEAAWARLRAVLAELGLEPKEAKTRIAHLGVGDNVILLRAGRKITIATTARLLSCLTFQSD